MRGEKIVLVSDQELDLQKLSEKSDLEAILLDLTMYQYDELVNEAFQLLVRHFSQREHFLSSLHRLVVLVDDDTIDKYRRIKQTVSELREHEEASEFWSSLRTEVARTTAIVVTSNLKKLCHILRPETERRGSSERNRRRLRRRRGRSSSIRWKPSRARWNR